MALDSFIYFLSDPVSADESACSAEDAVSVWTGMPRCKPRDTVIEVPPILDPSLFQVGHVRISTRERVWKDDVNEKKD